MEKRQINKLKNLFKFILNFNAMIIFLLVYYFTNKNLFIALQFLIIATILSLIANWIINKKIAIIPIIGGFFITLFGSLTIYLQNPFFIYVRPTILNILIGFTLLFGQYVSKEPIIKKILGDTISLNKKGWKIFTKRWIIFVFGLAFLNEIVWRTQSEEIWINLKVWGVPILCFFFALLHIKFIKNNQAKHSLKK